MAEVFKTNVRQTEEAEMLIGKFTEHFPTHEINFDQSDYGRILRVQGNDIAEEKIIDIISSFNYECEVLE